MSWQPLTQIQKLAATTEEKNMIVSAGAGTGKTRVLVERFLHFVTKGQATATEILALTFTEKAANEMKERILLAFESLGLEGPRRDLESSYISTIHAFASRVLREHPLEAGVDPDFRVLESEEAPFVKDQVFEEVMESLCQKGSDTFQLVLEYGQSKVKEGVFHLYDVARHEGKALDAFFEAYASRKQKAEENDLTALFDSLGETALRGEWQEFENLRRWHWSEINAFKVWMQSFSRKRGKKGDETWPSIKKQAKDYLAIQLDKLADPWLEKMRFTALAFEERYEARKKEESCLDFDDLQLKAVELFSGEGVIREKLRTRYQKKFRQILVDEFQDTNALQMRLIELLASQNNLFLVGDYKQSIYRFRGAEPDLFLAKEKTYEKAEGAARLPLVENFRSEAPVLEFINRFFSEIWGEDELVYENLVAHENHERKDAVEWVAVLQEKGESLSHARMREADAMAERMLALHEEGTPYGEMAVLFQAMKEIGVYEQALKKRGIPFYAMSGRGFYHQHEIRDMLSYLAFLENPLADIPLAAALRSPLFQISDETLFWLSHSVKAEEETNALLKGVKNYQNLSQISSQEKEKIGFFLKITDQLLAIKDRLKITELLDHILEKTSFALTSLADSQGVRRYANLKKLVYLAREFEALQPMTLGAFLRTVRRLEVQEARESEAQIEAEQSGHVVRLLTIHRAKGLEFPVVFMADLGRGRQSSSSKTLLAGGGQGFGMQLKNPITQAMENPYRWQQLDERASQREKEEWKRLFYVGCTRAKSKLILTGVTRKRDEKKAKNFFREMSTWAEWLENISCEELMRKIPQDYQFPRKRKKAMAEKESVRDLLADFKPESLDEMLGSEKSLKNIAEKTQLMLNKIKPVKPTPARVIDLPVSAYAAFRQSPETYRDVYEIGRKPASPEDQDASQKEMSDEDVSQAADFGTAMHYVLEHLDFRDPQRNGGALTQKSFGVFQEKERKEAKAILGRFLQSHLFQRLQKARAIYREIPFVLNERHGLLHGVLDVLFQDEAGGWHIVDYKTAVGDEVKVQKAAYDLQIALYAVATHKILNQAVNSGILYFLKNDWEYAIPFEPEKQQKYAQALTAMQEKILDYRQSLAG